MANQSRPERPDHISKYESYLQTHNLTFVAALALYIELVLRLFYHTSISEFPNFGAVYEFLKNLSPLSFALLVGGSLALRLSSWYVRNGLMDACFGLTHYFRRSERKKIEEMIRSDSLMDRRRAEEAAHKRGDALVIRDCERLEQQQAEAYESRLNVAMIFVVVAANLFLWHRGYWGMSLIMGSPYLQLAAVIVTGLYAGTYPSEWNDYVLVPEGYHEDGRTSAGRPKLVDAPGGEVARIARLSAEKAEEVGRAACEAAEAVRRRQLRETTLRGADVSKAEAPNRRNGTY